MQRTYVLLAITAISLLAAHTAAVATPQADNPAVTFRTDVSLGRVDAQVVDGGNHPIRGLRVHDFILRVDGRSQEIRNFQSEKMPIDVVLLLHVSRNMEPHIRRIASASHQALRALGSEDRIATMVFDRFMRLRMPFRPSRLDADRELESVLDRETFEGGTDITRGLLDTAYYVEQNARRHARRAIVIVTDDETERSRNEAAVPEFPRAYSASVWQRGLLVSNDARYRLRRAAVAERRNSGRHSCGGTRKIAETASSCCGRRMRSGGKARRRFLTFGGRGPG